MTLGKREQAWAGSSFFDTVFRVQHSQMKARGVINRDTGTRVEWEVGDFYLKCKDLLAKRLLTSQGIDPDDESAGAPNDLKNQKLAEEVRKLKLANDREEGELVPRSEVLPAYVRGLKTMADVMDGIPLRLKTKAPDISAPLMTVILETIAESRNKAASETSKL